MDDDPHAKRSLADDPTFLASLTDLDRGLDPDDGDRPSAAAGRTRPPRFESPASVDLAPPPPARRVARLPSSPAPSTSSPGTPPLAASGWTQEESSDSPVPPPLSPPLATAPGQRRPLLDLFPPAPIGRDLPSHPAAGAVVGPRAARGSASPGAPPIRLEPVTYETFYGLNEKPFSLSADPKFLYHSASHDRAAQALLDAIHRRDGIVLVTGELGVGKTTLCRVVLQELDRRTLTSALLEPIDSVEDLFKTVLVDFGVASRADLARAPHVPRAELTATLRSFIASLGALQANAVIIIDEAQNLPVDVLQEIPGLAGAGGESRLLQVVLSGQPSLTNLLKRPELRLLDEDVAVRSKLGSLTRDEIGGYVTHRLSVAGQTSRVDFDQSALERIYDLSSGVPRVVNLLCDRALLRGHELSAKVINGVLIDAAAEDLDVAGPGAEPRGAAPFLLTAVALVALVLVGAGGALWVFQDAVTRTIVQWESVPAAPGGPIQILPVPLKAIPPPADLEPPTTSGAP